MTPVEVLIRTSAQTAALDTVKQKVQAVGHEAGRASAAGQQLSGRLTAGFSSVLGALSPVALSLAGVTTALLGGLTAGVAYNATLEQQTVAFRTLLGSADAAQRRMRELADFAATTPFELPELVNASRILQSLAGDELGAGDGLRLIGDAAAATGRNFDELAMWAGRLYAGLKSGTPVGEATMRLLEMGAISGETARKLNALAESGGAVNRPFQVLRETFGRFDGAMALQGETFKGLASTLKDTVMGDLAELTKGLTDQLKALVRGVLEAKGVVDSARGVARGGKLDAAGADLQALRGVDSEAGRVARRAEFERTIADESARLKELQAKQAKAEADTRTATIVARSSGGFGGSSAFASIERLTEAEQGELEGIEARIAANRRLIEILDSPAFRTLTQQREAQAAGAEQVATSEQRATEWLGKSAAELRQKIAAETLARQGTEERLQQLRDLAAAEETAQGLAMNAAHSEAEREALGLQFQARRLELSGQISEAERELARERREAADAEADALEDVAKAWADVESELSAYTREVERLKEQQLGADLQGIRSDWRRTPGEQRDAQLARGRAAVADGTMGGGEFGLMENQLGPDPRSWADSWTAMLTEMRAQNEAFAQNFVATVGQAFQTTFHLAADGLTAAIFQTDGWERQLARIPLQIGQQIVSAIIRMGLQWVTTQILMATMGKTIQAAAMAGTAPIAAAQSAIWATPATLATIASYGGAAAAAPGFIAAAQGLTLAQSLAAFAEGGLTPGTATLAVVGEKGPELVLPAHVTARLSPAERTALVAGDFSRGGPGGGGPTNVILVDDRDTAARWERERGEAFVLSVMGRNWHRFA